jgi:hypothetical protein
VETVGLAAVGQHGVIELSVADRAAGPDDQHVEDRAEIDVPKILHTNRLYM